MVIKHVLGILLVGFSEIFSVNILVRCHNIILKSDDLYINIPDTSGESFDIS